MLAPDADVPDVVSDVALVFVVCVVGVLLADDDDVVEKVLLRSESPSKISNK